MPKPGDPMPSFTLHDLERRIRARAKSRADVSYTRQLLDAGPERCARKLGEEATETIIAALGSDGRALVREAADLVYHLLVLLASKGLPLAAVLDEQGGDP